MRVIFIVLKKKIVKVKMLVQHILTLQAVLVFILLFIYIKKKLNFDSNVT